MEHYPISGHKNKGNHGYISRFSTLAFSPTTFRTSSFCTSSQNLSCRENQKGIRDFDHGKVAQAAETKNMVLTPISFIPFRFNKVISTDVSRPKKSRSKKEKEDEEEVLVIEGVDFERGEFVNYDVYVNDEGDQPLRDQTRLSLLDFVNVPHRSRTERKVRLTLAINELLDNLKLKVMVAWW
ncbi:hypothetical protein NC652_010438 [Populus alba x Populus x berolinensis]|nr:hypothetical protein NC652_010438 [Populus alba x Populus x berolinensis]